MWCDALVANVVEVCMWCDALVANAVEVCMWCDALVANAVERCITCDDDCKKIYKDQSKQQKTNKTTR